MTITGSNFTAGSTVTMGGSAATVVSQTAGILVVTAPAGSGSVLVVVTNPGGYVSNASNFTYLLPTSTATPTGTPSATGTASPTASITRTGTPTSTPSATPTQTSLPPTATGTPSNTPFVTATITSSVTFTYTITPTPQPTGTPEAPAVLDRNVWRPGSGQPLRIGIKAPQAGKVVVNVFDLAGEKVRRPFEAEVPAGITVEALWDGTNSEGEPCGAGIYIVSIQGAGISSLRKVVLLK